MLSTSNQLNVNVKVTNVLHIRVCAGFAMEEHGVFIEMSCGYVDMDWTELIQYLDYVQDSAEFHPVSLKCLLSSLCVSQSLCSRSRYTSSPVGKTTTTPLLVLLIKYVLTLYILIFL